MPTPQGARAADAEDGAASGSATLRVDAPSASVGAESPPGGVSPIAQWRREQRAETVGQRMRGVKTDEQIAGLRHRGNRHFSSRAHGEIVRYYQEQNETLGAFDEVDELLSSSERVGTRSEADMEQEALLLKFEEETERKTQLMMRASFVTNVVLLGIKIVGYVYSGSISILASALDSFLDVVSSSVLFFTRLRTKRANKYAYPIGNNRMQPLGIIVFSSIMGTFGFQIMVEAMRQIFGESHTHHMEDLYLIIGLMVGVIVVKFVLWMFCRSSKDKSVRTFAQDHINDVSTNIVGLAGALLGDRALWWLDPLFAVILSLYIIRCWTITCIENFKAMLGLSAPPSYIQKLTYLCCHFHPRILQVDTVRAYTFGMQLFVEVDIILPPETPLQVHGRGGWRRRRRRRGPNPPPLIPRTNERTNRRRTISARRCRSRSRSCRRWSARSSTSTTRRRTPRSSSTACSSTTRTTHEDRRAASLHSFPLLVPATALHG